MEMIFSDANRGFIKYGRRVENGLLIELAVDVELNHLFVDNQYYLSPFPQHQGPVRIDLFYFIIFSREFNMESGVVWPELYGWAVILVGNFIIRIIFLELSLRENSLIARATLFLNDVDPEGYRIFVYLVFLDVRDLCHIFPIEKG